MKTKFCSCKLSDKVWGVVSPTKLHRVTFSEDLAKWMAGYDTNYKVRPYRFVRGNKLDLGEKSKSGLYAIIGTNKDLVLRVTMFREGAELLSGDNSRHVEEIYLVPIDKSE